MVKLFEAFYSQTYYTIPTQCSFYIKSNNPNIGDEKQALSSNANN
jgi:hypothetical protein